MTFTPKGNPQIEYIESRDGSFPELSQQRVDNLHIALSQVMCDPDIPTKSKIGIQRRLSNHRVPTGGDPKERLPYEFCLLAIQHILDTKNNPTSCIEYASTKYGEIFTPEVLDTKVYCLSQVIGYVKDHKELRSIIRSRFLALPDLKKCMKLRTLLNKIYRGMMGMNDKRIDKSRIKTLEGTTIAMQKEIDLLKDESLKFKTPQEKAQILRGRLISQKVVAETLGVDSRTIRRWEKGWKEDELLKSSPEC